MKCPECNKRNLLIPERAERNMETYHGSCVVRTLCCKKLIKCYPQFSYGAYEYTGNATVDDWGN